MRLLVCGDRNWDDYYTLKRAIVKLNPNIIIEGECKGADIMARKIAEELGIVVIHFPADWEKYGRAAGPIRNAQQLKEGNPDLVLAAHNDIKNSKGTRDMIRRSLKANKAVYLITSTTETMKKIDESSI
jgi:hypothetical protein